MPRTVLKVVAMNCTLKNSEDREKSSTEVLLTQLLEALKKEGVEGEMVRIADFNVKPGVKSDEGKARAAVERGEADSRTDGCFSR
jgi:multimeric flavodoxin WrbA